MGGYALQASLPMLGGGVSFSEEGHWGVLRDLLGVIFIRLKRYVSDVSWAYV